MVKSLSAVDRAPVRDKGSFDCPHCGAFAKQTWYVLHRLMGADVYGNDIYEVATDGRQLRFQVDPALDTSQMSPVEVSTVVLETFVKASTFPGNWSMSQCGACQDFATWRTNELIYPRASIALPAADDMPEKVKGLYDEARAVVGVSRRAGAALARATMEALIKHIDAEAPKRANLDQRIERVIPTVSTSLAQMLTVIRHVGNKTLHVEDEPDAATLLVLDEDQSEIVELIFQSINDLVDEKITRPKAAAEALRLVPEQVRARVKGLDALVEAAPIREATDAVDGEGPELRES